MQQVMHYHTDHGWRHTIVETKTKYIHAVVLDGQVKVAKLPLTEARYMVATDISLRKAKKSFRRRGKAFGITKSAKAMLRN